MMFKSGCSENVILELISKYYHISGNCRLRVYCLILLYKNTEKQTHFALIHLYIMYRNETVCG